MSKPQPAPTQSSQTPRFIVKGCNNPAQDIDAVQVAIDTHGKLPGMVIALMGTFDFGEDGQVEIKHRAIISGDGDPKHKAIIKGGQAAFLVNSGTQAVRITNLEFQAPKLLAVLIRSCSGATVDHCVVKKVIVV